MAARHPTREDLDRGYMICGCGKFAHVFRASVLTTLPKNYHGERCPECNLWMVGVDKLRKRAAKA